MKGQGPDIPAGMTYQPIPLTKRELFAAMAMQGILSSFSQPEVLHAAAQCAKDKGMESDEWACTQAVSLADALLAQLEKSP